MQIIFVFFGHFYQIQCIKPPMINLNYANVVQVRYYLLVLLSVKVGNIYYKQKLDKIKPKIDENHLFQYQKIPMILL